MRLADTESDHRGATLDVVQPKSRWRKAILGEAPTAIELATLALALLNGVEFGRGRLGLKALLAVLNNLVIAGLPDQIGFFAAYAPVALAADKVSYPAADFC